MICHKFSYNTSDLALSNAPYNHSGSKFTSRRLWKSARKKNVGRCLSFAFVIESFHGAEEAMGAITTRPANGCPREWSPECDNFNCQHLIRAPAPAEELLDHSSHSRHNVVSPVDDGGPILDVSKIIFITSNRTHFASKFYLPILPSSHLPPY